MILIRKSGFLIIISLTMLTVLFSGCTGGQDVTSVVKALPEVQQFMSEHPNAKITVTYWSKEEVAQSAQEISQQCEKPVTPVAMYKATISEGDLKLVSWINADNQIVICSITEGKSSQSNTPTQSPTPTYTYSVTSTPTIAPTYALTPTPTPTPTATPTHTSTPAPTPTTTSDIGYIYGWSNPAGGSIYVDGNYKGTTDRSQYVIISTTTGYHTVEISKTGYEKYSESVYVSSGQYTTSNAYLTPISTPTFTPTPTTTATSDVGYINAWSSPAGGSIYVDGNYKGTDISISATTGYHTVEITKAGYEKYSQSVYVVSGQYIDVIAYLIPISTPTPTTPTPTPTPTAIPDEGYIWVWSNPWGGSIYVDGNYEGTTDSNYIKISTTTGSHTVEITKVGYEKYSQSVSVGSGQYITVIAQLTPISTPTPTPTPFGYIAVASDPPGTAIYIDGNYVGTTVSGYYTNFKVQTGYHEVEVLRSSPKMRYFEPVNVNFGQTTYVNVGSGDWL